MIIGIYVVLIITVVFLSIYISCSTKLAFNGIFDFKLSIILFYFSIISPIQAVAFCLNTDDIVDKEVKERVKKLTVSIAIMAFVLGCLNISKVIDAYIDYIKLGNFEKLNK